MQPTFLFGIRVTYENVSCLKDSTFAEFSAPYTLAFFCSRRANVRQTCSRRAADVQTCSRRAGDVQQTCRRTGLSQFFCLLSEGQDSREFFDKSAAAWKVSRRENSAMARYVGKLVHRYGLAPGGKIVRPSSGKKKRCTFKIFSYVQ